MASRLSTPSEGEIVESGSEKAIQSQPSVNGKSVDRTSRTRISRSPSPAHSSRRRTYHSRSRSRSPYRESRGSKRHREDDHYSRHDRRDPRNFRVHYENNHANGRDGDRRSYAGHSRDESSVSSLRYDDVHSSRGNRRPDKSRSPPRFSDRKDGNGQKKSRIDSDWDTRGGKLYSYAKDSGKDLARDQSVSNDRGKPLAATASSKVVAEQDESQTPLDARPSNKKAQQTEKSHDTKPDKADVLLDEATLIEQRRKRREAIKAKHRGQATPLLVQALNYNNTTTPSTSAADTPGELSNAPDARDGTPPESPRETSGPNSPAALNVANDTDLANTSLEKSSNEQEDGPSAADYDPTMDMQEDRVKHVSSQQNEVSARSYDETAKQNQDQDILMTGSEALESHPKPENDDFDMFADDDDMFADPPAASDAGSNAAKAVPVSKAKALDMSMLDDWDDEEGYYKIILGELLEGRYHVQLNLGRGMFSAVVRAMDEVSKKLVAIKIIRANDTMRKAALKEIDILDSLKEADPEDKKHLIRLERYFEHKGHLCMVFEHLSINLREVLKKFGRDVGINLKAVRAYAQQMFLGLSLLRKCNILHADLKPDNVLVNESRNLLKICDLGSASDASENEITPYLVSRFYRAPEIILGMPYDFAIDTWSIGCTLFELYTGKILFTGRTNNQMLRAIMECRGKFSHKALRKAEFAHLHFDDLLNFRSVEKDKLTGRDTVRILNLTKPTRDLRSRLMSNAKGLAEVDMKELNLFVDFLERCLMLNPEKRFTPAEALKHPFISRSKV